MTEIGQEFDLNHHAGTWTMIRSVKLTRRATRDLREAIAFYRSRSPTAANSWNRLFWRAIDRLVNDADSFPLIDHEWAAITEEGHKMLSECLKSAGT